MINTQTYDGRWTIQAIEVKAEIDWDEWRNALRAVHVSRQENFDRIEFEFSSSFVPVSRLRYVEPPFNLGETDETIEITGSAFLEIAIMPAFAHEIRSGAETVKALEEATGLAAVREIRRIYDYEGKIVYVLGLADQNRFRVSTLSKPARLVVDVNSF